MHPLTNHRNGPKAVGGMLDLKAFRLEFRANPGGDVRLVLDDQNALRHGWDPRPTEVRR